MSNNIKQILLLGCDVNKDKDLTKVKLTDKEKYQRSDSMIIVLINMETNRLALVSLMRDVWVNIEGYGQSRINAAIVKGGPKLAVNVVNEYFDLQIDDYVILNMENLVKIVDELGGIDIELTDEEIYYINEEIADVKSIVGYKEDIPKLKEAGIKHLNGVQTLTHVRDRYFGYCWKRGERQRNVLKAMATKAKNITNKKAMIKLGIKMLKYVKTSLKLNDVIALAKLALNINISEIKTHTIPTEGTYNMVNDGEWHFEIDFIENSMQLKELMETL